VLIMAWPWMPWLLLIYLILFFVQYQGIISLEEEFLQKKFGAVFTEYKGAVPSVLARWQTWGKGDRLPTTWRKAIRTERNSLQSFAAVTLLILLRWLVW